MAKKSKKEVKKIKNSKTAHILLIISAALLFLSSIFTVFARKQLALMLEQYGIPSSELALVTYGVIWFTMGIVACTTNYKIRKTDSRRYKWNLFIISIITMISGSGDLMILTTGIIMLISSIMYLRRR